MTQDLQTLRQWRTGRTDRVLRMHGPEGSRGVTLIELDFGRRRVADYSTAGAAVSALASGAVRWKVEAFEPEGSSWKRESAAKRKRPAFPRGVLSNKHSTPTPKRGRRGGRKRAGSGA